MTTAPGPDRISRLRLLLAAIVVGLVPWFVVPGRTVADTKIDLVADPWGYLARATSAWDPHAFFGQLQNQAYGYLFPMGPFFGVTRSLGVPEWACQRLWWSLVLVVGFVGAYFLIRRFGLAGPRIALLVALAYALSPRVLTVLGPISAEAWPTAVVPWLVIGADRLLGASDGQSRRRIAAVLGLLVASVGGVNATATIAALAVPSLYLLSAGRSGAKAFGWWVCVVAVATAWWTIPLVVLGKYAFPFLDFIESGATTTGVTSIPNVLRGTSHWIAYVPGGEWPAGAILATSGWLIFATMALALLGIAGLLRARHWAGHEQVRRFAILGVVLGVTVMSMGFGANLDGHFVSPFASGLRSLLDGSLQAFRNVHKFDPLVRLPLCLGLAALLGAANPERLGRKILPARGRAAQLLSGRLLFFVPMVVLVAGAVSPAAQLDLAPLGSFEQIPARWYAVSAAVDDLAARDGGKTLVAPASRYGSFSWGTTQDNPLEVLADSEIVNRSAIPLGQPGAIRVMDALDGMLTTGAGQSGLIDLLSRLGITRVVVPHDNLQQLSNDILSPTRPSAPTLTESTLKSSGLRLVHSWGKGNTSMTLWSTGRRTDRVDLYDAKSATSISGGPEAVVNLAAAGLLGADAPAYLLGEAGTGGNSWIQTDTLRKRLLSVAAIVRDEYSATFQSGEYVDTGRVVDDFPPAGSLPNTVREFTGISNVRSSSTASNPYGAFYRGATAGVASAFDNDFGTSWLSASGDARPEISFDFPKKTLVGSVQIQLATSDEVGSVKEVVLSLGGRAIVTRVSERSSLLTIPVNRSVDSLRIRLLRYDSQRGLSVGISNIAVEGLDAATGLRLPTIKAAARGAVLLARGPSSAVGNGEQSEDGRVLTRFFESSLPQSVQRVFLRPRRTASVERLIDGWSVSGPRLNNDLSARPGAALDKDPSTRWAIGYLAGNPRLSIGWDGPQTVIGINGLEIGGSGLKDISRVTIENPETGETRTLTAGATSFEPLTAKRLIVTIALSPKARYPFKVPDFTLTGVAPAPSSEPDSTVAIACGAGARVTVGATTATYTGIATRRQLLQGASLSATRCSGEMPMTVAGENVLRGESGSVFDVDTVLIGDTPAVNIDAASSARTARVVEWSNRKRILEVAAEDSARIFALHEGFNEGWKATIGGKALKTVEVDGWRQGYLLPPGSHGAVVLTFAPDRLYLGGLIVGGGLLILLMAMAVWPAHCLRPRVLEQLRRPHRLTGTILGFGLGAIMGGVGGGILGLVAVSVPRHWRFRAAAAASAALALSIVVWPLPERGSLLSFVPQALGLFLLCALAAELGAPVDPTQNGRLDHHPGQMRDKD